MYRSSHVSVMGNATEMFEVEHAHRIVFTNDWVDFSIVHVKTPLT